MMELTSGKGLGGGREGKVGGEVEEGSKYSARKSSVGDSREEDVRLLLFADAEDFGGRGKA